MSPLDSLLDIYMEEGMGEREAEAQLAEDARRGREARISDDG